MTPTRVCDYYAGKSVFITGATGFVGKVLVEKLLRCCPDVKTIYILMRPKKEQDVKTRLANFITSRVFERLQKETPKSFEKLRVITGDILKEGLGIFPEDVKELLEECQIIFNGAASVRFDLSLRDAVSANILGTKCLLELAKRMSKLEVFLHISTAYCRSDLEVLEEKIYPSKHRPEDVIACTRLMDETMLRDIGPKLTSPEPNTYAYTKFLAEDLVSQYAGLYPIAIARPSIVIAAYSEPMPGWVDTLNGPTGTIVGAGKGVIRSVYCDGSAIAEVIPVDMVVNGCIVMAYKAGLEKPQEVLVCNLTNSNRNPLTWQESVNYIRQHIEEYPFTTVLWYPDGKPRNSRLKHNIAAFFKHHIPAYFIDLLLFLAGKPRFMVKVQQKITYGLSVIDFYLTRQWNFKNDKFLSLQNILSPEDKKIFFVDLQVFEWSSYLKEYLKGAREYCCKEDPANLPQARRNMKRLYYAHVAFKTLQFFILLYVGFKFIQLFI